MKTFARIIALLCAVVLLVPCFASCANTQSSEETTAAENAQTQAPAEEVTVDNSKDKDGYLRDDLPDELDYKGETVSILGWEDVERPEFEILEDETGVDMVKDAIYNRNLAVEDRMGVTLEWTMQRGNNSNRAAFANYVQNCYSGGTFFDIIATYSRTAAMLCVDGLLQDINAIDDSYLNFEQPWWPKCMVETCSIDDSLFFISGDISTNILHFMYAIYYNMDLLETLNLEDPIAMVDNKTWTLDKLIEMTSNQYRDEDGDGKQSEKDFFGFGTVYFGVDAFYTGSGLRLIEHTGDDDLIKISDDFFSEKTVNLVDKLGKWMTTNDCWVSRSGASVDFEAPFADGRMLFIQDRVYLADNQHSSGLNQVEWKYGLVPTPLYDEAQEEYVTVIGNPFTLYGIMSDCDEDALPMMTAVIECWGSEAYRLTTPALFETNMKYKYTDLDVSAQMFDILRNTMSFDQGRIYANTLGPYISELPSKAATTGSSWTTAVKPYQKLLSKQLNNIITSFQKIQG